MDIKDYSYRATFTSHAKIITPSSEELNIATASIGNLKKIVPNAAIDFDANPDMLYIAFDGAVASMQNRNDDCLSAKGALAINSTAQFKYLSKEHDRDQVVGVIIHPAFSRFGSSEPITMDEAAALKEPFNMSYVGAIWRVIDPLLAKYIEKNGESLDENSLSMSWEVLFNDFSVAIGSPNLFEARIIAPEDPSFASYSKMLRANGGSGKDPSGNPVYRVIGEDAVILGFSVVTNPAAYVKGILPLSAEPKPAEPTEVAPAEKPEDAAATIDAARIQAEVAAKNLAEILAQFPAKITSEKTAISEEKPVVTAKPAPEPALTTAQNLQEKKLTSENHSVNTITAPNMKIESLDQLASQWSEIRQLESVAAVKDFVESIEKGSKEYIEKIHAAETLAEQLKASQAQAEKRANELSEALANVQKELAEVRASAEAASAAQKFSDRMASFDEKFDLDDEDRKFIADDIRSIAADDDAAFEVYAKKCDRLMAAKKKGMKKPAEKHKEPDGDEMKAAFASIEPVAGQTSVPKVVSEVPTEESLVDKMRKAFGASLSVNGKSAEKLAEDAAKAAK